MTGSFSSTSQSELAQRRLKLRRQRRLKVLQAMWRVLAVGSLAGGAVWVCSLPIWLIQNPEQVKITGNRFISEQTVRSLLPISYPKSLLWLEPQQIATELKTRAPISDVVVSRQLFPPSLTVQVKERYPVAIALMSSADIRLLSQPASKGKDSDTRAWLLDESGMQIPIANYALLERSIKLPNLKVIGSQEHYRRTWPKLYRDITRSPVKISEIDFQNPANLVLKTELAIVHVGSYGSRFSDQIKALDRLRELPKQTSLSQIAYIDLRDPNAPVLQMAGGAPPQKPDSSQRDQDGQ
jgi:cell division protein FtsQ